MPKNKSLGVGCNAHKTVVGLHLIENILFIFGAFFRGTDEAAFFSF